MSKYICKVCGGEFNSYNPNPQFCSIRCKADHQAPYINIPLLKYLYGFGFTQDEIAKMFNVSRKSIYKAMRRYSIKARTAVKRNQYGENNHMWKGSNVRYKAFHKRINNRFGQPQKCEICGTTDKDKSYDWASLMGDYENLDDYKRMCRSCHWKYDKKYLNFKGAVGGRKGVAR